MKIIENEEKETQGAKVDYNKNNSKTKPKMGIKRASEVCGDKPFLQVVSRHRRHFVDLTFCQNLLPPHLLGSQNSFFSFQKVGLN